MRPKASADIAEARDKGFSENAVMRRSTRNAGDELRSSKKYILMRD
jgi:hypothetical protein